MTYGSFRTSQKVYGRIKICWIDTSNTLGRTPQSCLKGNWAKKRGKRAQKALITLLGQEHIGKTQLIPVAIWRRPFAKCKGFEALPVKNLALWTAIFHCIHCGPKSLRLRSTPYLNQHFAPRSFKRKSASVRAFYHEMKISGELVEKPFDKLYIHIHSLQQLPQTTPSQIEQALLQSAYDAYTSGHREVLQNIIV